MNQRLVANFLVTRGERSLQAFSFPLLLLTLRIIRVVLEVSFLSSHILQSQEFRALMVP